MITPVAVASIGYRCFLVYMSITACIPVFVFLFLPETMGRSLEEIDFIFRDAPSAWSVVSTARNFVPLQGFDDAECRQKEEWANQNEGNAETLEDVKVC
jgi:hypothetical protein